MDFPMIGARLETDSGWAACMMDGINRTLINLGLARHKSQRIQ